MSSVVSLLVSTCVCVAWGVGTLRLAKKKGYPSFGWFFLGFFLGLIGLIIVLCITDKSAPSQVVNGFPGAPQPMYQGWTCSFCGQLNPMNATVCTCGTPMPGGFQQPTQQNYYQAPQQAPQMDPNATPYENQMNMNQQNGDSSMM